MNSIYKIVAVLVVFFFVGSCTRSSHSDEKDHLHVEETESAHDHDTHEPHQDEEEKPNMESAHSDEILFSKEQALASGLKIEVVNPLEFRQVIKTSGQVLSASADEVTVVASTNGVVDFSKLAMTEGMNVTSGQPLATVSVRNMAEGNPLVKVKAEYEAARLAYERAKDLVVDKIVSVKEFDQTKMQYEKAKTAYEALSKNASSAGIRILSPMSGFVKNRLVEQGEYVTMGQPLLVISQNRRLQLRADVSEKYFKWLRGLHDANFRMAYGDSVYRLSNLNGRLLSFGKSSTGKNSFVPVIFEFDNVGDVVPGSFAEVYLLSSPRQNVLSVPLSALTESQGVYSVYVNVDEEGYRRQEVTVGQSDGDRVEILSGLKVGDRVVTRGATQVRLASSSSAIPSHNHEH